MFSVYFSDGFLKTLFIGQHMTDIKPGQLDIHFDCIALGDNIKTRWFTACIILYYIICNIIKLVASYV